jgi:hypothetical protein
VANRFLMVETLIFSSSEPSLAGYVVPNADDTKRVKVDFEVYLCIEPEALLLPVFHGNGDEKSWQALGIAKWAFTPQEA